MNKLFILRGLPGSGKTTIAEFLYGHLISECEIFAADDYFTGPDGTYNFDQTKLGAAHFRCLSRTKEAMREGIYTVIVHNTFTTEKELKPYLELAKEFNYEVISLVVENRHGNKSIHNVPEEAMERMENRFSLMLRE